MHHIRQIYVVKVASSILQNSTFLKHLWGFMYEIERVIWNE